MDCSTDGTDFRGLFNISFKGAEVQRDRQKINHEALEGHEGEERRAWSEKRKKGITDLHDTHKSGLAIIFGLISLPTSSKYFGVYSSITV